MRMIFLAPLLLLACESTPQPYAPVANVRYQAIGAEPFWLLTIGDDRIVLRTAGQESDAVWPRTLPRTVDDVRTWQSGDGTAVITIEARAVPCRAESGRTYADSVTVRLSGRELTGCGGRLLDRS